MDGWIDRYKDDRYNGRVAIQGYRTDKNYKTGEHRHCPIAGMLIVIA